MLVWADSDGKGGRTVELKCRGPKKNQTSACSSSGLDEMVRQARLLEMAREKRSSEVKAK